MVRIHSSNIVLLSLGLLLLALSIQPASASPQSVVATTRVPPIREPSAKPPGTRLLNETENDLILSDWSHHSRRLAATKLWDVTFSSSVNSGQTLADGVSGGKTLVNFQCQFTSATEGYLITNDQASYRSFKASSPGSFSKFTYMTWIKPTAGASSSDFPHTVVEFKTKKTDQTQLSQKLYINSGALMIKNVNGSTVEGDTDTNIDIVYDTWVQLALIYDHTNLVIYQDLVTVQTYTNEVSSPSDFQNSVELVVAQNLNGQLYQMKMWGADMPYYEFVNNYEACRILTSKWSYYNLCLDVCASGRYTVNQACVLKDSVSTTPANWILEFKFESQAEVHQGKGNGSWIKAYEGYQAADAGDSTEPSYETDLGYKFTLDTQFLSITPENTYVFNTQFTICSWVKPDWTDNEERTILIKQNKNATQIIHLYASQNDFNFKFKHSTGSVDQSISKTRQNNKWQSVCVNAQIDGSVDTLTLFVDGQPNTPVSETNLLADDQINYNFYIGNNINGKSFRGYIYWIYVNPTVVSASDILNTKYLPCDPPLIFQGGQICYDICPADEFLMEGVCANTSTCVDCPEDGVADFTFSSNTPPLKDTNNKIVFFKGNDSTNDTANEPTFDSSTEGFSFDASTEKLTVTYDTALVLSNEFNIYSWVKCTDTSAKGAVFEKKAQDGTIIFTLYQEDNKMKFLLNYSGNQVTLEGSPTSFNDWIFVKINSTSARNNELFINGSSVATSTTTNATADETKDRYTLLFGNNSTSDYWRGVIWQINFTKSTVTIAYNQCRLADQFYVTNNPGPGCITSCGSQKWQNGTSCDDCNQSCNECDGGTNADCTACATDYVKSVAGNCLTICPSNEFDNNGVCVADPCPVGTTKDTDQRLCIPSCESGKFLLNNKCVSQCGSANSCPSNGKMDLIFDEDVEPTLDTNDLMKAFKGTDFDTNASIEPTFAAEDQGFTFASTQKITLFKGTSFVLGESFTIFAWVNSSDVSPATKQTVFTKKQSSNTHEYSLYVNSSQTTFSITWPQGTISASGAIANTTWTKIIVTSDQAVRDLKIYIDDTLKTTQSTTSNGINDVKDGYSFLIGNSISSDEFFNGKIFQVSFESVLRDLAYIQANLNTCRHPNYFIFESNCISTCPTQKYKDSTNCLDCNAACNECTGPQSTDCVACNAAYYLESLDCISSCPSGKYGSDGTCVVSCPDGKWRNELTKTCEDDCTGTNVLINASCATVCAGSCANTGSLTFKFTSDGQTLPDTLSYLNAFKGSDSSDEGTSIEPTFVQDEGFQFSQSTQKITVPSTYSFILGEDFTFKAWVRNSNIYNKQALFQKHSYDTVIDYTVYVEQNKLKADFTWVGNSLKLEYAIDPSLLQNWMEIYLTSTASVRDLKLYINGLFRTQTTTTSDSISDEKQDFIFLIGNNITSNVWVGNIYEIGFTPSVVSASTISSGFNECIETGYFKSPQYGCINACPFSTYRTGNNCYTCDNSCYGCTGEGNTNCSQCASGYNITFNNGCYSSCPNPYLKYENGCVDVCPSGTIAIGKECKLCTQNCIDCQYRCNYCLNINSVCVLQPCTQGVYLSDGTCQSCTSDCAYCEFDENNIQTCKGCKGDLVLDQGTCKCQTGFTQSGTTCTKPPVTVSSSQVDDTTTNFSLSEDLEIQDSQVNVIFLRKGDRILQTVNTTQNIDWTWTQVSLRSYNLKIVDASRAAPGSYSMFVSFDVQGLVSPTGGSLDQTNLAINISISDPNVVNPGDNDGEVPVVEEEDDDEDYIQDYYDSYWFIASWVCWIILALVILAGIRFKKFVFVWGVIEFLQVLGYLPLVTDEFEPEVARFLGSFNWFNYQYNPFALIIFDFNEAPSLQCEYSMINHSSFVVNGGLMMTIGIVLTIVYLLTYDSIRDKNGNASWYLSQLVFKGFLQLSFLPLLVASMVQFKYFDSDSDSDIAGLALAIIYCVIALVQIIYTAQDGVLNLQEFRSTQKHPVQAQSVSILNYLLKIILAIVLVIPDDDELIIGIIIATQIVYVAGVVLLYKLTNLMILITQSAAGLSIVIMEFVVLALILDDAADEVFYSLGLILFFLQLGLIIFSYIKYEYHFGFKVGSGDVSIDTIRGREQPMKPEEQSNQQDNNES